MSLLDEYAVDPKAKLAFTMEKMKYMEGGMSSDEAELQVERDLRKFLFEQEFEEKFKDLPTHDTSTSKST